MSDRGGGNGDREKGKEKGKEIGDEGKRARDG